MVAMALGTAFDKGRRFLVARLTAKRLQSATTCSTAGRPPALHLVDQSKLSGASPVVAGFRSLASVGPSRNIRLMRRLDLRMDRRFGNGQREIGRSPRRRRSAFPVRLERGAAVPQGAPTGSGRNPLRGIDPLRAPG